MRLVMPTSNQRKRPVVVAKRELDPGRVARRVHQAAEELVGPVDLMVGKDVGADVLERLVTEQA